MANKALLLLALLAALCLPSALALQVSHDGRAITIDGERRILISGSIHYPRSTPEMWPKLMQKAKEGGLDAIETYVFWNAHEPRRRQYNFEANLDLVRFIKEIQNAGLYAVLRIGPYACAEWNYGGLPVWLHQIPGIQLRTDNELFKKEMQIFTTLIVDMMKKEDLLAPQGGPIILTQIENEYGNVQWSYGDAGKRYVQWCAKMAESLNVSVPWIMCQQDDAPYPMLNTCNGFYCEQFRPNNAGTPKMWTENWTGWYKNWDKPDPHRPAEELAYAVARFFQLNGTFQNYYMYHGGTNFGRSAGGPYITTTYDYDAPLDEYGNIRQPKWGHLKELHAAIKKMEKALLQGNFKSENITGDVWLTSYSAPGIVPGCFLANNDVKNNATVEIKGYKYFLPAYSVSVLPDCKNEVYNTAKVTTQTTFMILRQNFAEDEPAALKWSWKPEDLAPTAKYLQGTKTAFGLVEQKLASGDQSDYLWYMTSVNRTAPGSMTLHVYTEGHILYAFVNGELIGSHAAQNWPFNFTLEQSVSLKAGANSIALLSVTVGLANYGANFDLAPAGVVGPVKLIGANETLDLSKQTWTYKIGLDGEDKKVFLDKDDHCHKWMSSSALPTNTPFTWYKTTFKAPVGTDSVVVDLHGLGKGVAWVNGNSLGRYWPSHLANNDGCQWCDYRRKYNTDDSCRTGCGEPAQRRYHVPRSFMKAGENNSLVLLEEAGGDPSKVQFVTVSIGTACGSVEEGKSLTLSCQGRKITGIKFASFGDPVGECGSFKKGTCETREAPSAIEKLCLGGLSCTIEATEFELGACNCTFKDRRLAVEVFCD